MENKERRCEKLLDKKSDGNSRTMQGCDIK